VRDVLCQRSAAEDAGGTLAIVILQALEADAHRERSSGVLLELV
jgi:hypothetical protein